MGCRQNVHVERLGLGLEKRQKKMDSIRRSELNMDRGKNEYLSSYYQTAGDFLDPCVGLCDCILIDCLHRHRLVVTAPTTVLSVY